MLLPMQIALDNYMDLLILSLPEKEKLMSRPMPLSIQIVRASVTATHPTRAPPTVAESLIFPSEIRRAA